MPKPTSLAKSPTLRKLAAFATLLLVAITLGCMSLSFGERTVTYAPGDGPPPSAVPSDGVLYAQEGTAKVKANGTSTIYYPLPYASSPNLEVREDESTVKWDEHFEIVEQRPDRFTVRNTDWAWAHSLHWVAKGARPAPPAGTAPPPPEPALPPRPVPIDGSSPPSPETR
jgi:hypothetical protein